MDAGEVFTNELIGEALDWAIAQSVGFPVQYSKRTGLHCAKTMTVSADTAFIRMGSAYRPSTDWSQGGMLIDEHKIDIEHVATDWHGEPLDTWVANSEMSGPSALIAACRALVLEKLGETIFIPVELIK